MEKDLSWLWNGEKFKFEDYAWAFGFVYRITNNLTGKKYIGRKYFYSTNKIRKKGRKNRMIVRKQSNWIDYYGSSKTLQVDITEYGKENFTREILSLHESRGDVNYNEIRQQILADVLNSDLYYNDNIMNRYYRKKNITKSLYSEESRQLLTETNDQVINDYEEDYPDFVLEETLV